MRPPTIGLIVDLIDASYQMSLLLGMAEAARAHGVRMLCFAGGGLRSTHRSGTHRNFVYDLPGPENVDGVILLSSTLVNESGPSALVDLRARLGALPVVSVGGHAPDAASVVVDPAAGLREGLYHLIRHHHLRRIAFIRGPKTNEEAEARFRVYRDTLAEHDLPLDDRLVLCGDFNLPSGTDAIKALLASGIDPPRAVVAANDYMALGAAQALADHGLRVPTDVAVLGFDDVAEARVAGTPLTTVRQPFDVLAEQAVLIMLARLRGEPVRSEVVLPTQLVIRQSCGCGLDPDDATAPGARAVGPDGWGTHLARLKERVAFTLGGGSQRQAQRLSMPAARMVDALEKDLRGGEGPMFIRSLGELVTASALPVDDMARWHDALTMAARTMAPLLEAGHAGRLENMIRRAYVLVAEMIERARVRQTLQVRQWSQVLTQTNEHFGAALDPEAVMRALAGALDRLEVARAYVLLIDREGQWRSALTYGPQATAVPPSGAGAALPARQLFPADADAQAAAESFVVLPLFAQERTLGVAVYELGPREGALYELLRDQVSAALSGVDLKRKVLEEIERRQRAEQERLRDELAIAARIQTMILPRTLQVEGLDIAAAMLPASEVGGDYYDVLPFPGGAWLGIGDVAGHGLATGLMALMIQSAAVAVTHRLPDAGPDEVVEAANAVLYENVRRRLRRDEHATLSLLRYRKDGTVVAAGGHDDLIVCRARTGRCEAIHTGGQWIGIMRHVKGKNPVVSFTLEPGDLLVLCSDGILEAPAPGGELYEIVRFCEAISAARERPVGEIRDRLLAAVKAWAPVQRDDITLLVARYTGAE